MIFLFIQIIIICSVKAKKFDIQSNTNKIMSFDQSNLPVLHLNILEEFHVKGTIQVKGL